eukprot:659229-Pyramimonas_sp.AAC.1
MGVKPLSHPPLSRAPVSRSGKLSFVTRLVLPAAGALTGVRGHFGWAIDGGSGGLWLVAGVAGVREVRVGDGRAPPEQSQGARLVQTRAHHHGLPRHHAAHGAQ